MNLQEINKTLSKIVLSRFKRGSQLDNSYTPPSKFVCVRTSIDEGKDLTDIERKQHVFKTTKEL